MTITRLDSPIPRGTRFWQVDCCRFCCWLGVGHVLMMLTIFLSFATFFLRQWHYSLFFLFCTFEYRNRQLKQGRSSRWVLLWP